MSGDTPEKRFWNWFLSAEAALRTEQLSQHPLLRQLSVALQEVDPDLTYELMVQDSEHAQLVISANGVRELIPVVDNLVSTAPTLPFWKIISLRQRRALEDAVIKSGEVTLATSQLSFHLSLQLRRVDVTLYISDQADNQYYRWLETVFLLLDAAIGERDVALHVGEVFIREFDAEAAEVARPFVELPEAFDAFLANAQKTLQLQDQLQSTVRRETMTAGLKAQASQLYGQLQAQCKELGREHQADSAVTVEVYYRELTEEGGQQLVTLLEKSHKAVAEQIEFGGVSSAVNWVHSWFDVPLSSLETVDTLIDALAQEGYMHNCELESVFLTWSEEAADISNILANLETLGDAEAIIEAHRELENNNPARAVELLEDCLNEDPENIEIRALLAYAYAKLNDEEMAEACLEELKQDLAGDTEHPSLFWNIACAYALLAEAQEACENLRLAFALDPELRELALNDPDLSRLRGEPEFDELLYQA